MTALSNAFLVLIFVLFLLIGGGAATHAGVWQEITWQVQRYISTKALLSSALLVGQLKNRRRSGQNNL